MIIKIFKFSGTAIALSVSQQESTATSFKGKLKTVAIDMQVIE
jgi:hypothetical protein